MPPAGGPRRPTRGTKRQGDDLVRPEGGATAQAATPPQHVLVNRLVLLYEPVFIHDSYANRVGKGTHAAVDRLQAFMREATHGGARPAYALQLDIANFFNNIHWPTLFRLLQGRLARAARSGQLPAAEGTALQTFSRALPLDLPLGLPSQRPGLGPCTEWPLRALPALRRALRAQGVAHTVVAQSGHFRTGFKRRSLVAVWRPAGVACASFPSFLFNRGVL